MLWQLNINEFSDKTSRRLKVWLKSKEKKKMRGQKDAARDTQNPKNVCRPFQITITKFDKARMF